MTAKVAVFGDPLLLLLDEGCWPERPEPRFEAFQFYYWLRSLAPVPISLKLISHTSVNNNRELCTLSNAT